MYLWRVLYLLGISIKYRDIRMHTKTVVWKVLKIN